LTQSTTCLFSDPRPAFAPGFFIPAKARMNLRAFR
jgi:hypothetical protein